MDEEDFPFPGWPSPGRLFDMTDSMAWDFANFDVFGKPTNRPNNKPPAGPNYGYPPYGSKLTPRPGYIDGGYVLTQGITVTRAMMEEAKVEEWNAFADAVDRMGNIAVDELLEKKLLWVYDLTPTITSMEN